MRNNVNGLDNRQCCRIMVSQQQKCNTAGLKAGKCSPCRAAGSLPRTATLCLAPGAMDVGCDAICGNCACNEGTGKFRVATAQVRPSHAVHSATVACRCRYQVKQMLKF